MPKYYKNIKFLLGKKFKKIFPLSLLFLMTSLVDLFGIGLIGAYVAIIFDPTFINKLSPYQSLDFIRDYQHAELIFFIGLIMIGIFILKFIFLLISNFFILSFATSEQAKIQKMLVEGMLNQSYENFLISSSGDNLSSVANFSGNYREVLQAILQIISNSIVIIAICAFLGLSSLSTLIILISFMALVFGIYNVIFAKRIHSYGENYMDGARRMIQGTTEIANGLKEIKTLGKENFFIKLVRNSTEKVRKSSLRLNFLSIIPRNLIEVILIIFIVSIVFLNLDNNMNISTTLSMLGIFTAGMVRVAPLISQLQICWNTIVYGQEAINKLSTILGNQLKDQHNSNHKEIASPPFKGKAFSSLQLNNITYSYPGSDLKSINDVTFQVNKGDFIGLIGPSGAGKTSLINVILGFLKPSSGTVEFNDCNISDSISLWREYCAYLPQDIFLIDGTLKENITFENKGESNLELINNAIELSRLSNFISDLPDGIETQVGDKGVRLSGGQKQRVAIARAIYHQRELLILDESTSALDSVTEKEVMEELIGLRNEKTIIAIAHRITTLKECNKIFKLNAGKLTGPFVYDDIVRDNMEAEAGIEPA